LRAQQRASSAKDPRGQASATRRPPPRRLPSAAMPAPCPSKAKVGGGYPSSFLAHANLTSESAEVAPGMMPHFAAKSVLAVQSSLLVSLTATCARAAQIEALCSTRPSRNSALAAALVTCQPMEFVMKGPAIRPMARNMTRGFIVCHFDARLSHVVITHS